MRRQNRTAKRTRTRRLAPTALLLASLCLLLATPACRTPVGVKRVDARRVHRSLTANVLTTGAPSAPSLQALRWLDLQERFEDEPEQALAEMHARAAASDNADLIFALAELSFLQAEESGDRSRYLAAAVYAYAFLFPDPPSAFDPRLRLASDLYNRGITSGLASEDGAELRLESGTHALPFGELEVEVRPEGFRWGDDAFVRFVPAAELEVRGLRNRYRRPGVGAPLTAETAPAETGGEEHDYVPPRVMVAVTAFLRIQKARQQLGGGRLRASLELYAADDTPSVRVAGRDVPLEYETTSSLASSLSGSALWDFELRGFMSGDEKPFDDGLIMLSPYRPGRVPVVFVHGTASSPGRWAEMVNDLSSNPRIAEGFQLWFFLYNTGNPIPYSAGLLRESLQNAVARFDPDGSDPALGRMVVIGHSQGGLLTKMTSIQSGSRFWDNVSEVPFEELEMKPESRGLLRKSLFFEPLPFVKRLIFIATPHRGSFLAARRLGRLAAGLVTLPVEVLEVGRDLLTGREDAFGIASPADMPTSIDQMSPSNRFVRTLVSMPVVQGVAAHSIIPVKGEGPPEERNDGVVSYQSAHLDDASSEKVVRSGHSTQSHPDTILEVHRILLEHLGAD
jgi:triacylglycerol esterase/lipase EstA (alpha/beta hydrolase family)